MLNARDELVNRNAVFIDRGCLFVSTTGLLLTGYVNCEVIFPHFDVTWDLVGQLIYPFIDQVECFACPSTGDIVLAEHANIMANQQEYATTAVWADKQKDNSFIIERNGFVEALAGRKVLILNDRISQGGTTRKMIAEVRRCGGDVIGVSTLAGISSLSAEALDIPMLHSLCTVDVESFADDAIPPEHQGLPISVDDALGHGSEYQADHPDYPGGFVTILS